MRHERILVGILYLMAICIGPAMGNTVAALAFSTVSTTEQERFGERPFDLMVGDEAPRLEVDTWIQGEPIDEFEKGHVYVLDFWATWCRPCVEGIPHMTKLHEKYKGKATVIGMNIWQRDPENVEPFVTKMGKKMPYRIATDLVPEGREANEGKMATNWVTAAGQQGIPSVFIVDGAGIIAWIGHPSEMDEPLAQIVGGSFDLDAHAKKHWSRMEKVALAMPVQERLYAAMGEGSWEEAIVACDELLALDPEEYVSAGINKFQVLLQKIG
ncbi:MAG: TlpA family protein disulfide reductase, partial [Candidatus Latescibacterota bacterium]